MRIYSIFVAIILTGLSIDSFAQDIEVDNLILNGNLGKYQLYTEWQSGQPHRMSFVGSNGPNSTSWLWDTQLHLYADGRLVKRVSNPQDDAFVVQQNKQYNFVVKGNGMIYARGLEVTMSSFPDYVFSDDYELMPLTDLKNFIQEYNKLPNIPSASDIAEDGVELGELSRLQMEKIEELTIYIIELQDRLEKLESQKD